MNRGASLFLRIVVVLIGVGVMALLLWEPHLEGRNQGATLFAIYFNDPFLAYVYFASIPFFVGLYQAFKVLGYAGRDEQFSPSAVRALRTIKLCAIALVGLVAVAEVFIITGRDDDHAGAVAMGVVIALASIVVATAMAVLERAWQNAVDLKSESDLTI